MIERPRFNRYITGTPLRLVNEALGIPGIDPVLSKSENEQLGKVVQDCRNLLGTKLIKEYEEGTYGLSANEREVYEKYVTAANKLAVGNIYLIPFVIAKNPSIWNRQEADITEVLSALQEHLIDCSRAYDPKYSFSTFFIKFSKPVITRSLEDIGARGITPYYYQKFSRFKNALMNPDMGHLDLAVAVAEIAKTRGKTPSEEEINNYFHQLLTDRRKANFHEKMKSTYRQIDMSINTRSIFSVISGQKPFRDRYGELSYEASEFSESITDGVNTVQKTVEDKELKAFLDKLMRYLTPKQAEVLKLRFYDELQVEEIARKLGVSRSMVDVRLRDALKILRQPKFVRALYDLSKD